MKTFYFPIILASLLIISACSQEEAASSIDDITAQSWADIEAESEGTEVRLYMWGGDEGINQYIDEWLQPQLEDEYGVELERIPMETEEILQKLQTEQQAGKQEGTIDIIWLNGENFKTAKDNDLLAGSFVDVLPNFNEYYQTDDPAFSTDFGTDVDGMEAPWGKVQFVFHYDSEKVKQPPSSFAELKQWISENPGEFTYPNAEDFTGNAFLRHLLYEQTEQPSDIYSEPFEADEVNEKAEGMWTYLNEIEPDLWRSGDHYPNSLTELDRLYGEGEVSMTMGYNEARAEKLIDEGTFPDSTKSFVMEPGSIGNTHFLSIPFNSTNKEGALAAINYMLSPEAQLSKLKQDYWGENTPISYEKLPDSMREEFEKVERGDSVLDQQELEESFLPESEADYVEWIEDYWFDEIVQE
ncbi:ABC transporter substrate-binding protein [Halobacillus campisalis]|uniref:ABC transporter substrate-binding protein n=1 Tax=Halobacillus campisalis TaxID=435909 RepID=A0ABW2K7E5_9BACI|nr:ABC transporter substrate-binding protein [Halobacillus campisalis]